MVHNKKTMGMKEFIISLIIVIALIIAFAFVVWIHAWQSTQYQGNILIMGLEPAESHEGRVCDGLGWADLNMIVSIQDRIRIVSFPRDTLVEIPGRGKWLINSIHYNQGFEGSRKYFEKLTGLQIDKVIIVRLEDVRELARRFGFLGRIHPAFKRLLQHYEYTEDWIRHRRQLGVEYNRQLRIQKYLNHIIDKTADIPLPNRVLNRIGIIITNKVYRTDLKPAEIAGIKREFSRNSVEFYIWPGEYRKCAFNYSWYQATNYCYIIEPGSFWDMIRKGVALNPFIYSTNHFFAKANSRYYNGVTKRSGKLHGVFSTFQ